MKTTCTILSVVLAASLLAVESQAADLTHNSRSTGSVGKASFSTGKNFHQGNLNSSALKSSSQLLVKHNGPSSPTKLGQLNTANKFNAVAVKNPAVKLNLNTIATKNPTVKLNLNTVATKNAASKLNLNTIAVKSISDKLNLKTEKLLKERLHETTTGTKDPRTGQDLSKNANPGFGLPGGKDLSKDFPSAEQQWNDRLKGSLAGGTDYLGQGTPFDDTPGSNPTDDFLNQHGANIPDPLAGYGQGRSGFSPAQDEPGTGSVTVGEITFEQGSTSIFCASDYIGKENLPKSGDVCVIVQFDGQDGFKTETDRKTAVDFWNEWVPKGTNDQQYEGEGGYTGGGGHSANDLYFGTNARMTGKVVGGRDPGEAGLGKDTGGRTTARFEAIEKYVIQGGKVRGAKAGYQSGDSGLGQDIGGAAENKISGLKKINDAQRFVIDPNALNPEEVPWWLQEKVSPVSQASTAQVNAVETDLEQGVAAQQNEAAETK